MVEVDPDNEATFKVCVIPSEQRATAAPKEAIMQEVEACGFGPDAIFRIKLALEEALTNAVKHGNRCDPNKQVVIRYAVNDTKAVVIIRDEGQGFDPDCVPDPTSPERLPLPNGRGIMLMKAYMDEVEYRDCGREVYFVKKRQ